jgi:hypothetical protein
VSQSTAPEPQYPLPDSLYPGSKDWLAGKYHERVEWLHSMYTGAKSLIAEYERQLAACKPEGSMLGVVQFQQAAPGIEVGYDLMGGVDIRLGGDFVYVHINYDWRYTDNASRKALADDIVGLLSGRDEEKPTVELEKLRAALSARGLSPEGDAAALVDRVCKALVGDGAATTPHVAGTSQMVPPWGQPSPDDLAGMNWWNAMSKGQRLAALQAAGTPTPAVAWAHYKTTRSNAS